jgi:hypothetical protein
VLKIKNDSTVDNKAIDWRPNIREIWFQVVINIESLHFMLPSIREIFKVDIQANISEFSHHHKSHDPEVRGFAKVLP